MTQTEKRMAKALVAFRESEGFNLTDDQYESLIDQIALACSDLVGNHAKYDEFHMYCWSES